MQKTNKRHSLKDWVIATRPWSFPASAMPVLVTLAYLLWRQEDVNWFYGVWAMLNIVLFHAAGNTWSDYFDFIKGVDAEDTYGSKTITGGKFEAEEIRRLALGLLTFAVLGGLALLWCTGWELLWIGLGGVACTLLYPTLKYMALGDLVIAIAYAWLPMWGTSFVATGHIDNNVLLLAVPVGMITVAILHVNNARDIATDKRARIETLAMRIGRRNSNHLYSFLIGGPFVILSICLLLGVFPLWTLLAFLALPQAVTQIRRMESCPTTDIVAIANLDEMTAKLQLMFSLLLSLSFIIAYWCL